jgi:hypothetical protein
VPTKVRAGLAHVVLLSDRGPVRFTGTSDDLVPQPQSSSVTALPAPGSSAPPRTVTRLAIDGGGGRARHEPRAVPRPASRLGYSPHVVLNNEQEYERYYYDACCQHYLVGMARHRG